ncbi:MAG: HD domain-containing protein [Phycisphaeraceae bacterium]
MPAKIVRDPLYNYIGIDDPWIIDLLDCPEVQRLRRIHQLGVSEITYPGASHTRFAHTLGVLHLMQEVLRRLETLDEVRPQVQRARAPLLAAAVLHDVGHGPFSHLFESCLGINHEKWSTRVILDSDTQVNKALRTFDGTLPAVVAALIDEDGSEDVHPWQKFLLSSQLDVDRMDYLRRDSLFTGSGYGHFDWYRLINTLDFHREDGQLDIVWPEKAKFAIEEFIFARYYMYQNVYLHKTTRGFEQLLQAMWERAKQLREDDTDVNLVSAIAEFWNAGNDATVDQYLRIEEFTVLEQIQRWQDHDEPVLSDLARRFLSRDRFAMIEGPEPTGDLAGGHEKWEAALRERVAQANLDPDAYCLRDELKAKYMQPYFPEPEREEQSAGNAIRVMMAGDSEPTEISKVCPRLQPIARPTQDQYRYYVPMKARDAAERLRQQWREN